MRCLNKLVPAFLIIVMIGLLMISTSDAQEQAMVKKIVLFHEDISWAEIEQYAYEHRYLDLFPLMRLPLVHGLVVLVPAHVSSSLLSDDPRVLSVESNQKIFLWGQAVDAAADGGAADGGAADGGAADGGAADGGAADGGAADGGAADGGAADGGASAGSLQYPPSWSFILPVSSPPVGHRPWGILKLFGQLRNPELYTDVFDPYDVPGAIKLALNKMKKQRVRVAIFDTGVDFSHPSLSGMVKPGINLYGASLDALPWDDNGHGTHVTGTLCSRLQNQAFGMAPRIDLYSVKILNQYATGDLFDIIMGLQWAVNNDIDIVNMSIGYRESSQAVRMAIQRAYQAGLIMVAAAGNRSNWDDPAPGGASADGGAADGGAADGGAADGGAADGGAADGGAADGGAADGGAADGGAADGGAADGGAADAQGNALTPYSVMYPARYPEVIAVGACTSLGEFASFSNSGPQLVLTAPGTGIVSTNVCGGFGVCSGTSMAAPHVTASVAMMLALDPYLSSEDVEIILEETAKNYDGQVNHGAGELNLIGSLEKLASRSKTEDQATAFERQMHSVFKRIYREELKKKLRAAGAN